MSRANAHSNDERAAAVREKVRTLVSDTSFRRAADEIGVSLAEVRGLLDGRTPREEALTKMEAWAEGAPEDGPDSLWKSKAEIGELIEQIMQSAGLTQGQLAELLGMPKGQAEVSRYIRGKRRPGYEKLLTVAQLAGQGVEIFQRGPDSGVDGTFEVPGAPGESPRRYAFQVKDTQAAYRRNEVGEGDLLREMWRRVDAVDLREDLTPLQREMVKERELQIYRQATQERETRVAEMRTRVMEKEAELAVGRTRAIQAPAWRVNVPDEAERVAIEIARQALSEYALRHAQDPAPAPSIETPEGQRVAS